MTIFDYLKDILVNKTGSLQLDHYSPYMINRWISFIDSSLVEAANLFNTEVILEDKEMHYKSMLALLPKLKYVPKINYVKKAKEQQEEKSIDLIRAIASQLEISQREVHYREEMTNFLNVSNIPHN